jgi:hypothetical protein
MIHVYERALLIRVFLGVAALLATSDVMLLNGKIITVDPQFRIADSMAILVDRVLDVGNRAEVSRLAVPGTPQRPVIRIRSSGSRHGNPGGRTGLRWFVRRAGEGGRLDRAYRTECEQRFRHRNLWH